MRSGRRLPRDYNDLVHFLPLEILYVSGTLSATPDPVVAPIRHPLINLTIRTTYKFSFFLVHVCNETLHLYPALMAASNSSL